MARGGTRYNDRMKSPMTLTLTILCFASAVKADTLEQALGKARRLVAGERLAVASFGPSSGGSGGSNGSGRGSGDTRPSPSPLPIPSPIPQGPNVPTPPHPVPTPKLPINDSVPLPANGGGGVPISQPPAATNRCPAEKNACQKACDGATDCELKCAIIANACPTECQFDSKAKMLKCP